MNNPPNFGILAGRRLRNDEEDMNGLGGAARARVRAAHDGEAPAGGLAPVENHSLGILEGPGELLPVHPAGDEVRGPERRLRSVHDACRRKKRSVNRERTKISGNVLLYEN